MAAVFRREGTGGKHSRSGADLPQELSYGISVTDVTALQTLHLPQELPHGISVTDVTALQTSHLPQELPHGIPAWELNLRVLLEQLH